MPSRWSPGCNCCGDCTCDTEIVRDECDCNSVDYGTESTLNDVTITISGSPTSSGSASCGTAWTCPGIAGTYVYSCNYVSGNVMPARVFTHWNYICFNGIDHIYSAIELEYYYIRSSSTSPWELLIFIRAGSQASSTSTNPYPNITDVTGNVGYPRNNASFSVLRNDFEVPRNKAYRYELATCDPSCPNEDVLINDCVSGSQSFTDTFSSVNAVDGCDVTGLSVSIAY